MAALHEKYLWPLIGIVIFAVLAAFYIDDRRRLVQETTETTSTQQASTNSASTSSTYASGHQNKPSKNIHTKQTQNPSTAENNLADHKGFSGSIDKYLAKVTAQRSEELIVTAGEHQGFSGSIDEYLSDKPTTQTASQKVSSTEDSLAKTHPVQTGEAYHGSMEDYLSKYGNGAQTPIENANQDPFHTQEHQGFHGTYEDYAKKFN